VIGSGGPVSRSSSTRENDRRKQKKKSKDSPHDFHGKQCTAGRNRKGARIIVA
jgi:hypothetical protein